MFPLKSPCEAGGVGPERIQGYGCETSQRFLYRDCNQRFAARFTAAGNLHLRPGGVSRCGLADALHLALHEADAHSHRGECRGSETRYAGDAGISGRGSRLAGVRNGGASRSAQPRGLRIANHVCQRTSGANGCVHERGPAMEIPAYFAERRPR